MDNANYVTLTRQSGLLREMQAVANNIANMATTGFRKEGLVFSEYVQGTGTGSPSLSMALADVRATFQEQGGLTRTGASFDLAIEGDGFFMVSTPEGDQLTRAGSFSPDASGELVTPEGFRLLDIGGAPVFVPPDAGAVRIATDGTISVGDRPLAQIGVFLPEDPTGIERRHGVRFMARGEVAPVHDSAILQGFLEESNVNPVVEIARMIEVQRAYELGQTFLEKEDERIRSVLQTLGK